jgi:hypothetical protein
MGHVAVAPPPTKSVGLGGRWAVRHRYVTILLVTLTATLPASMNLDWASLNAGGKVLLGPDWVHVYARQPTLQAGPPSLLLVRLCDVLSGGHGLLVVHLAMAGILPLGLWIVEEAMHEDHRYWSTQPVRIDEGIGRPMLWCWLVMLSAWSLLPSVGVETKAGALLLAGAIGPVWARLRADSVHRIPVTPSAASAIRTLEIGLLVAPAWALLAGGSAHLDDGVTLLSALVAMSFVQRGHWVGAAVAVGAAIAFKPWGVAALPLLFALPRGRRAIAIAVASAVPALAWAGFIIGDPHTLSAAGQHFGVMATSPLALFHGHADVPSWWRTFQLSMIVLIGALAVRRRGWPAGLAAAMCTRLLFDPATFSYYSATVIVAIAIFELVMGYRPVRTGIAMAILWALPFAAGWCDGPLWRAVVLVTLVAATTSNPRVARSVRGAAMQVVRGSPLNRSTQIAYLPMTQPSETTGTDHDGRALRGSEHARENTEAVAHAR